MNKNRQQRAYEAPSLSAEEVRIEKAFLADAVASAGELPEGADSGTGSPDGSVDDWFFLER